MLAIALLVVAFLPLNPDHYRSQTTLSLLLGAVIFSHFIARKTSVLGGLLTLWVLASAVLTTQVATSPLAGFFNPAWVYKLEYGTLSAALFFLLSTLPVIALSRVYLERMLSAFALLVLLDSLWMIGLRVYGIEPAGILDASSIDASFVAATLPLLILRPSSRPYDGSSWRSIKTHWVFVCMELLCVIAPIAAVLWSRSSTGLGALCVVAAAQAFARGVPFKRLLPLVFTLAAAAFLFGRHAIGVDLLNSSGRAELWGTTMAFWSAHANFWRGFGLGTFQELGPALYTRLFKAIWLHNDWLQILFELGAVGLALSVAFFTELLIRAKRQSAWLFTSVVAYGFTMALQMPLRHGPTALLGTLLVAKVFTGRRA